MVIPLLYECKSRRATSALILNAFIALALVLMCFCAERVHADGINVADPDVAGGSVVIASTTAPSSIASTSDSLSEYEAHLAKMPDEQLKKMLADRSQGKNKVDWKKLATREAVMDALLAEDREEARRKLFLSRVHEALDKQAKSPVRDDFHNINVVYCPHSDYEADVHRYEEALFEKVAMAKKKEELEKKAKKEKKSGDATDTESAKPITMTFSAAERSLFLPNADRIKFTSEVYPLPKYNAVKSQILFSLFVFCMVLSCVIGQLVFVPEKIRSYLVRNRTLLASTGLMFNMFSGTAKRTGAFEVYVDGSLVYSHLAHGGVSMALPSLASMSELLIEKTLLLPYGV